MEEIFAYRAKDGEIFESQEDCRAHEYQIKFQGFIPCLFDMNNEPTENIYDALYLNINTEEELQLTLDFFDFFNINNEGISGIGFYIFTETYGRWVLIEDYLKEISESIEKMLEKLKRRNDNDC